MARKCRYKWLKETAWEATGSTNEEINLQLLGKTELQT
jgi:hypothetical protein